MMTSGGLGRLAASVMVAVVLSPAGTAAGAFPGANGRIVFVDRHYAADGRVVDRLRSVRPDGRGRRTLLRNILQPPVPAGPFLPRWSPSGRRIVLTLRGDVITIDARGRDRQVVAPMEEAADPSWSPGGRLLVARQNALFVMAPDGSGLKLLLGGLPGNPEIPMWAPDGGRVAFEIYTAGTPTLWTARTNGTGAHPIVPGAARPAFSPDGRAIAYALGDRAWIMRAAGGHARAVSPPAPGEVVHGLAFSPDGRFLVIARQRQILPLGPSRLFVVRLRDEHERDLHVGALAGSPDWQPLP
jgi:Tol biopolymer transport system component